MPSFRSLLKDVVEAGRNLAEDEAQWALDEILDDRVSDSDIAALLTALATRGETAAELTGFVRSMRARITPLPFTDEERFQLLPQLIDTCGTGGDGCGTFNISTAAALVAVAAGAKVAKHGNRAVTSRCGSADVLEALGIPVDLAPQDAVRCLRETGFVFLYAPSAHPAMRRVQPVRRALPFRTIFNLAGPLANPAGARNQIVGVYSASKLRVVADAMLSLGVDCAYVFHARNGLDEIGLCATDAVLLSPDDPHQPRPRVLSSTRVVLHPHDVGLAHRGIEELAGGPTPADNARLLEAVFAGHHGPHRDVVLLNAAAALQVARLAASLPEGVQRAAHAIDSGALASLLARLRAFHAESGNKPAAAVVN
jgi:anthranilate phosphoribosyltransferase